MIDYEDFHAAFAEKNISLFYRLIELIECHCLNKPPENLASRYKYITPSNDFKQSKTLFVPSARAGKYREALLKF